MKLATVLEWLKTYNLFSFYYIGKIVGSKQNVLGVYARGTTGRPVRAFGNNSGYDITSLKLLVHGDKNENNTQTLAIQLYEQLFNARNVEVGDDLIYFADILCDEPIDVGTDANDIFEFVINLDIYTKRR